MAKMGIITLVHLSSKKLSLDILLLLFIKQKKKEVYMSSLYLKYLKEKKENEDTYYLFKVGNFYIFIDEDAKKISKVVPLKLTNLTSDILKCGFPINALERYLTIFKNLSFKIKIIEEKNINVDKVIKKIKNINIEKTTPIKALNILNEIKGMLNE